MDTTRPALSWASCSGRVVRRRGKTASIFTPDQLSQMFADVGFSHGESNPPKPESPSLAEAIAAKKGMGSDRVRSPYDQALDKCASEPIFDAKGPFVGDQTGRPRT